MAELGQDRILGRQGWKTWNIGLVGQNIWAAGLENLEYWTNWTENWVLSVGKLGVLDLKDIILGHKGWKTCNIGVSWLATSRSEVCLRPYFCSAISCRLLGNWSTFVPHYSIPLCFYGLGYEGIKC